MAKNRKSKVRELDAILLEYASSREHEIDSNEAADHILDNDLLPKSYYRGAKRRKLIDDIRASMRRGVVDQDGVLHEFSNFVAEVANDKGGWVQQQFYKENEYLSPEQCLYQWDYCTDQMEAYDKRRIRYRDLCIRKHGVEVTQKLFPVWTDL